MPLNEQGFEVRRFSEINESLISQIEDQLGTKLSRDPDAVITILLNNVASELTDLNELVKGTYDSFDIYKAEGVQLDNRVAQLGIYRYGERPSRGYVQFTLTDDLTDGVTVPVPIVIGSQVKTVKGTQIQTTDTVNISALYGCYSCTAELVSSQVGVAHTLEVNGANYTYVPQSGDTLTMVRDALLLVIQNASGVSFTASAVGTTDIKITNNTVSNNGLRVEVVNPVDTIIKSVIGTVPAATIETGELVINPATVNDFITVVNGVDSVQNITGFLVGSSVETDDELRTRYLESLQVSGVATVDAIQDKVAKLSGVETVFVLENDTNETVAGRPPHSFEVIVAGGTNSEIAQTIWDTKPASARAFGSIQEDVIDITGKAQVVNFSRPLPVYVWVEVTYDLYSEEVFPADGEDKIAKALAEFSSELALGEDLYPQKFLGAIYGAADGLGTVSVQLATSLSSTTTSPDTAYTNTPISIADNQQPVILANKVTFA